MTGTALIWKINSLNFFDSQDSWPALSPSWESQASIQCYHLSSSYRRCGTDQLITLPFCFVGCYCLFVFVFVGFCFVCLCFFCSWQLIGLCTGSTSVHFGGPPSWRWWRLCNWLTGMMNDLARAMRRWTEKSAPSGVWSLLLPTEKKDSGSWVFEPWWMNMHMSAHNAAHGFTKHKNTLMTQAW